MKVKIITSDFKRTVDLHAAEVERFLTINGIQTIHHMSTFSVGAPRGTIATMIVYEE